MKKKLVPCLSIEQLTSWGVKTGLFPALKGETSCANLSAIPQASTDFQFAMQRLVLSTSAMRQSQRKLVDRCHRIAGMKGLTPPCLTTV